MDTLLTKIKNTFKRRENKEMEESQKFWGGLDGASDIARSVRETAKFQARSKFRRNMIFFLITVAFILFTLVLLYVYVY